MEHEYLSTKSNQYLRNINARAAVACARGQERRIELNKLSGRYGVIYVAKNMLRLDISERKAERIIVEIKLSLSKGGRQSSVTPIELRALIKQNRGA